MSTNPTSLLLLILLFPSSLCLDCSFTSTYPRQYITYKLQDTHHISIDGRMDEEAWEEVGWTDMFVDISSSVEPRLGTRAKIRWDEEWLYVGAVLEEKNIWANITHTCHCIDPENDQVIFHDNDFEIFIDADGSTHNYKEFEMNAANATWDLMLDKPYSDGGVENSSRVFGPDGFDMQPPLVCATKVEPPGALNNPNIEGNFWSLEVALPWKHLVVGKPEVRIPPKQNDFWRINFSRVEWKVLVENGIYVKDPNHPTEDNWVWSPQGEIAMHLPERWGFLQFSESTPNNSEIVTNPEWTVRQIAMTVYYAEHGYADSNDGIFTSSILDLIPFMSWPSTDPQILLGGCSDTPFIQLWDEGRSFTASIESKDGSMKATINNQRFLQVVHHTYYPQPIIDLF